MVVTTSVPKPVSAPDVCADAYQQALLDFGVSDLIETLSNFSDPGFHTQSMSLEERELESLAALLIQQLSASLQGRLINDCLNILRDTNIGLMADRPVIELKPLQTPLVLPDAFPDQIATPAFQCGDQVRWIPAIAETETDTGWVIGYFYAYAQHQGQWAWKYLVWLNDSPGVAVADTAWEQDLELSPQEQAP